jgi:deoxycytidylate deaminase
MPIRERITPLSKRDARYLERALLLAGLSDCKQKHGAIIVKSGRIIGTGVNTFRNDPVSDFPADAYSLHAEISALRSIKGYRQLGKIGATGIDLRGAKLYVARSTRRGGAGLSRPCDNCHIELVKTGITEVIYTT